MFKYTCIQLLIVMIGLDKYHHIQMSINIQEEVYKNVYAKEIEKENYMYLNF